MQIIFQINDNTLIAKIVGELDHHVSGDIKNRIDGKITSSSIKNLVFDFSNLSFMDSSGIGVIIGRYKLITSLGGKTLIVSNTKVIDRLLNISGVKKIINIKNNIDEALIAAKEG